MKSKYNAFLLFLLVGFLVSPITTLAASKENNSFKTSIKKTIYSEPVTLSWSVPKATDCYLYGPTSTERNVPDTYSNFQSVIVTPDLEHSDWQEGKKATYTLTCKDNTKLDKDGNHVEIFSKEIVVSLIKPKISKKLDKNGVSIKMTDWQGDITLTMHQPKKWKLSKNYDNPTFNKTFKNKGEGSLTIEQDDDKILPSLKSFVDTTTAGLSVKNIKSGTTLVGRLPALYVEYTFDDSSYKKVVFVASGVSYYISAQTPTIVWRKESSAINESIKTVQVY